jgi:HSP20 family protein
MLNIIRHHDPIGRSVRDLLGFVADEPFFRTALGESGSESRLPLDIAQGDGELIVRASMPGFGKDDIEVQIHEGLLTIKAAHTDDQASEDERFYRRERRVGALSRRVALPGEVSDAEAHAELTDGVLTLRIPQAEESRPRQIPIE